MNNQAGNAIHSTFQQPPVEKQLSHGIKDTGNIWYPSLNGLRAISIFLVIIHHIGKKTNTFHDITQHRWIMPLIRFIQDGHLGVNIFFVISGFLITSLLLKEEEKTGTISVKKFFIRRVLRTFPAYYFLLSVYLVLTAIGLLHVSKASFITAFSYTKYVNWHLDWFTAHAWSLSIEEQFYLCWPLIFIGGNRCRKTIAWILVLIVPVIRVYTHYSPLNWMGPMTIFWRIDAIATGCLFAMYRNSILALLSRHWNSAFWISVIMLFGLRYFQTLAGYIHAGFIFIPLGLTNGTVANLLIAIILMYSVFGPRKRWFRFLNLKPMHYIGILSYSLYLWQQLFISGLDWWVAQYPQNILIILAAALFSYYMIEKPFLRLKKKFSLSDDKQPV